MTRLAALFASPVLMLAACEQPDSQTSMDLLRAGDPGICTAADVEDTVRRLIRPKGTASDAYTISFADASLESFDKVVARATCNAAMTIDGPEGTVVDRTMVDFTVSPAAQDTSTFIVSGAFRPFSERLENAVADSNAVREEQNSERQAQEALAAMVKPGWLIGRWVPTSAGSFACTNGPFDDYARGGRLIGNSASGRWRLIGQDVAVVLPDASISFTITSATMNEFTMEDANQEANSYRRCDAEEMLPAQSEVPDEPPVAIEPQANASVEQLLN